MQNCSKSSCVLFILYKEDYIWLNDCMIRQNIRPVFSHVFLISISLKKNVKSVQW